MRVALVVGARPQFIKAVPVLRALVEQGHEVIQIHTGQHYDYEMSAVFFEELDIPAPDHNLRVGSGSHGLQTGKMLMEIEPFLVDARPDWTVVFGDTNSTLAAGIAACKSGLPLAHVEAGLRSFNREMPEEHNRRLVDHCADLLLCPTETAVDNLRAEGIGKGVHLVGDTMYDAVLDSYEVAQRRSSILQRLDLEPSGYFLATVHRPCTVDDPSKLASLFRVFRDLEREVVLPMHPRTQRTVVENPELREVASKNVRLIDPVGYFDILLLQKSARLVLTDSGGMQKEALFLETPCVTLRAETEWVETVESGWNVVAGTSEQGVRAAIDHMLSATPGEKPWFGDGAAAGRIVEILEEAQNCGGRS